MADFFDKLLGYADTYGPLIPLGAIIFVFSARKMPKPVWILVWYLLFSFLMFGTSNYLADRKINNLFLYHIFTGGEFIFLGIIFQKLLQNNFVKKAIVPAIFLFNLFLVCNSIFFEEIKSLNSNTVTLEFLLLIILCIVYYFELANSDKILFFLTNPYFWIVSAFFIYFTGCIVVFALYKYAAKSDRDFILNFWLVQVVFYIVKNILLAKGILCFRTGK